jgi:hypothetical protein
MIKNVVQDFVEVLEELSVLKSQHFSGAGLVLYDDLTLLAPYHCNLVNDGQAIPSLKLGTRAFMTYLLTIADYRHPYHDGFHFINHQGVLTHVAQFFSPPVYHWFPNILGQGARTFCSQCGSNVKGVLLVGSVSSNHTIYLFEKGKLANDKFLTKQPARPFQALFKMRE